MGGLFSSNPEPTNVRTPPPEPTKFKPWRQIKWTDRDNILQTVSNYEPPAPGQQIRILLHGIQAAGKSSFINSVQSVLHGRMCVQALAASMSATSFTTKFRTYRIHKPHGESFYPFVFSDTRGLETNNGLLINDINLALKGHVKDGYEVSTSHVLSESDPFYNTTPTDNDKVHVLVCVVPADRISQTSENLLQQIRDVRKAASKLNIPQVAIFTRIDEFSNEIRNNLKDVYSVISLKRTMEKFSADVGIPMNCIFPVKNYHEEVDTNSEVDSLLLSALKNIINFGDDFLRFSTVPQE